MAAFRRAASKRRAGVWLTPPNGDQRILPALVPGDGDAHVAPGHGTGDDIPLHQFLFHE